MIVFLSNIDVNGGVVTVYNLGFLRGFRVYAMHGLKDVICYAAIAMFILGGGNLKNLQHKKRGA